MVGAHQMSCGQCVPLTPIAPHALHRDIGVHESVWPRICLMLSVYCCNDGTLQIVSVDTMSVLLSCPDEVILCLHALPPASINAPFRRLCTRSCVWRRCDVMFAVSTSHALCLSNWANTSIQLRASRCLCMTAAKNIQHSIKF
jgi:hypothetical protein